MNITLDYKLYESDEDYESDKYYDPAYFDLSNIKFINFILTIGSSEINNVVINELVDLEYRKFTTTFSATDPLPVCISICAAKVIIEPLAKCFDTDIFKYLDCLKSKGITIAFDVIKCVIECYGITS